MSGWESDVAETTDIEYPSGRSKKRLRLQVVVPPHGHRIRRLIDGEYQFVECSDPSCNVLRLHILERARQRRLRRRLNQQQD
jgi:hypothetical protein